MKLTKLLMDSNNRKLGLRGGIEKGNWYIRIDLWSVGYRLS